MELQLLKNVFFDLSKKLNYLNTLMVKNKNLIF